MRHKKLKLSVVLLLVFGLTTVHAQEAIPASGGNGSGTGGSISYTVGQVAYVTNSGSGTSEAQGVQQPYEISIVTSIEDARNILLDFVVYPNPTTNFVILKTGDYDVTNVKYLIYDAGGQLIESNQVAGNETNISMQEYKPAIYFLKVVDKNNVIKIFKIIKK
jgi:hypothetical protein